MKAVAHKGDCVGAMPIHDIERDNMTSLMKKEAFLELVRSALMGDEPLNYKELAAISGIEEKRVENYLYRANNEGLVRLVVTEKQAHDRRYMSGYTALDNPRTAKWPDFVKGTKYMEFPGYKTEANKPESAASTPLAPAGVPVTTLPYIDPKEKKRRKSPAKTLRPGYITGSGMALLNAIKFAPGLMCKDYAEALKKTDVTVFSNLKTLVKYGHVVRSETHPFRWYPKGHELPKKLTAADLQVAATPAPTPAEPEPVAQQEEPQAALPAVQASVPFPAVPVMTGTPAFPFQMDLTSHINGIADVIASALVPMIMSRVVASIEDYALTIATAAPSMPKSINVGKPKRIKVLLLGLRDKDASLLVSEFPQLDLTCVTADSSSGASRAVDGADYVIGMTDFMGHFQEGQVKHHPNYMRVTGGLSTVRSKLTEIRMSAAH